MKLSTRFLVLVLLTFSLSSVSFSQCNVETREEGDWIVFDNHNEDLYKNEDLENGAFFLSERISLFFNKTDKSAQFQMTIFLITNGYKKEILPRQCTINFGSYESITLTAETSEGPISSNGGKLFTFTFRLPKGDDYVKLRDKEVTSMSIQDTRTGQTFKFNPYSGIIKEQIGCITKIVERK